MALQTIYLAEDLTSVDIYAQNGLIAFASGVEITILRPVNEYMTVPKWTEALRFTPDGAHVNCVKWAPLEGELAAGSAAGLSLYHIRSEYGIFDHKRRWHKPQPAPVEALDITADGNKLVSYTFSHFDSFAKVWMRISYGDSTSLFDLVYADHLAHQYLVHFQWRSRPVDQAEKLADHNDTLASMSHIKNFRSFMPSLTSDDHDILYTVTNDHVLNVWATCDFNGHSYLKLWSQYHLSSLVTTDYVSFLVLDGANSRYVHGLVENSPANHGNDTTSGSSDTPSADYLLVIGRKTSHIVRISNVTSNPPNSITFDEIGSFATESSCIPSYRLSDVRVSESYLSSQDCADEPTQNVIKKATNQENLVENFFTRNFPVACTDTLMHNDSIVGSTNPGGICFLVHDRVKSTLRSVFLDLSSGKPTLQLKEKFQGHSKSVKKLYTSSLSHEGNIVLSSSSFPDHNYLWEPFMLGNPGDSSMAITKRFRLNVTRDSEANLHEQGIENAVLLNDIYPPENASRHHLAVIFERGGFLSLWDCNGATMDDKEAALVARMETMHTDDSRNAYPQAFFSKYISSSSYAIIAIYDPSRVEAWRVDISPRNGDTNATNIACTRISTNKIPGEYSSFTRIAAVDTFLEKDLTLIDEKGILRSVSVEYDSSPECLSWKQTSLIYTNIERASLVHGASLVGKVAIVNELGNTLSIWDSKTGVLEYEEVFPDEFGPVKDLDWTFLGSIGSTANPLLSVGFSRFVLIYTQLRYDYTNKVSTFVALKKIDISDYSSHEIGDSIWIDDSQLLVGYNSEQSKYPIADLVRILNGPLPVYHPQFLIQALLMDETHIVEAIMVKLLKSLRGGTSPSWNLDMQMIDLMSSKESEGSRKHALFDTMPSANADIFDSFNSSVADLLSEKLTSISLPLLTRHQQTTLRNLVILMNKLAPLRKSLDPNGMKFMYGFELFHSSSKQKKLTMRDLNWAVHSDQKEMLFASIENHYHRLTWSSVKEVGLAYWVDEHRLRTVMESAARNEFADERDPSGRVSILYLAIKKKQVLLGLWRTVFHPEKDKVVKFLSNNFSEQRWKSAALKNAFVLLGKHRYMDAAYFFLLAEKVKDCCMILCNKVQEFDLALAVARVNSDQEAARTVLEHYILPQALVTGDRWTTSWAFWEMRLKEISIQALVMSPIDVVTQNASHFSETFRKETQKLEIQTNSKSFLRVDPVLGVLYQKLRSSKSMYLQGSKAVSPEVEFDFVVRLSTIYSRMGCDYLSLLVLRNWKFLNYSHLPERKQESHASKDIFSEFSSVAKQQKSAPEPSTFEEPDMSAFSFGF
ncbi:hypothetical protein JCM33374_g4103 [Metschnikowia sp. JCM 33374]|nr:hypothetical protein JCM33374_g4103 [Metschnikowia sp. JCM 33374]